MCPTVALFIITSLSVLLFLLILYKSFYKIELLLNYVQENYIFYLIMCKKIISSIYFLLKKNR